MFLVTHELSPGVTIWKILMDRFFMKFSPKGINPIDFNDSIAFNFVPPLG